MRMRGVEPPRAEAHRHLKPARLPIPPHPQGFLFAHFPDNNCPGDTNINDSFRFVKNFSGLCKTNETKNLQKRQILSARPPPNKFEGATLYSISNATLDSVNL